MEAKDFITLGLAAYGAVLTTYVVARQRGDKKPKIEVKASWGAPTYGIGSGEFSAILRASNKGERDVTLAFKGLRLPDGRQMVVLHPESEVDFPHTLVPGKWCHVFLPAEDLRQELAGNGMSGKVTLKGEFEDQTESIYSVSFEVDVDKREGGPAGR